MGLGYRVRGSKFRYQSKPQTLKLPNYHEISKKLRIKLVLWILGTAEPFNTSCLCQMLYHWNSYFALFYTISNRDQWWFCDLYCWSVCFKVVSYYHYNLIWKPTNYQIVLIIKSFWLSNLSDYQILLVISSVWLSNLSDNQICLIIKSFWLSNHSGYQILLIIKSLWLSNQSDYLISLIIKSLWLSNQSDYLISLDIKSLWLSNLSNYWIFLIIKSFWLSNRSDYQISLIIKSF